MASASSKTVQVEKIATVDEKVVVLELDEVEAYDLMQIVGDIGGRAPARETVDGTYVALRSALGLRDTDEGPRRRFTFRHRLIMEEPS